MGSGASKVGILKCPKDFDAKKFKKITQLFDKLDKDSNFGVSSNEIEDIAKLHVENAIQRMALTIDSKALSLKVANNAIMIDEKSAIAKIKQESEAKRQNEQRIHDAAIQRLGNKIAWYESLDESGKSGAFMKAVSPGGGEHLDFWTFFEYMKTRTDDIKNIED
tara:strand:- start:153 stop:644 length:492 start_codon:yes stop_codon:yes gene_type:complete